MTTQSFGRTTGGLATIAAAGDAQTNATACTGAVNVVTAADDAKGVILPAGWVAGETCVVVNTVSNKVLKVYPPSGGQINNGTANAAVTIRAAQAALFVSLGGDDDWAAVYDTDTDT